MSKHTFIVSQLALALTFMAGVGQGGAESQAPLQPPRQNGMVPVVAAQKKDAGGKRHPAARRTEALQAAIARANLPGKGRGGANE